MLQKIKELGRREQLTPEGLKPGDVIKYMGAKWPAEQGLGIVTGIDHTQPGYKLSYEGYDEEGPVQLKVELTPEAQVRLKSEEERLEQALEERDANTRRWNRDDNARYQRGLRADAAAYGPVWDDKAHHPKPTAYGLTRQEREWILPSVLPKQGCVLRVKEIVPEADILGGSVVIVTYEKGPADLMLGATAWAIPANTADSSEVKSINGQPVGKNLGGMQLAVEVDELVRFEKKRWPF